MLLPLIVAPLALLIFTFTAPLGADPATNACGRVEAVMLGARLGGCVIVSVNGAEALLE